MSGPVARHAAIIMPSLPPCEPRRPGDAAHPGAQCQTVAEERRTTARDMWHRLETIHSVVYFAPEVANAYKRIGLKGFWMGYFAGRAAPLGHASPELVTALFFNFHPAMVSRALPEAWRLAPPPAILAARLDGIDEALHRLLGERALRSADIAAAADLVDEATRGCELAGRPLFAAYRSLPRPDSPHLRLWHAATLIREHRGDGHVAANLAYGLDGLAAHLMLCATGAVPRSSLQPHRGWSDEEWDAASRSLSSAGVIGEHGQLTEAGRTLRQRVEDVTDRLASEPWTHIGADRTKRLDELLRPVAESIVSSGIIPFPNPMGLPGPPVLS